MHDKKQMYQEYNIGEVNVRANLLSWKAVVGFAL